MYKEKRENFRKNNRRAQLETLFKAKRLQIQIPFKSSKNISKEQWKRLTNMNQAINSTYFQQSSLNQLIQDIKQLINLYPREEPTYIIMANFFIKYPKRASQFKGCFFRSAEILNNNTLYSATFIWSLIIFIRAYFFINVSQDHCQEQQKYKEFLVIDELLSQLYHKNVQIFFQSQKQIQVDQAIQKLRNFLLIFNIYNQQSQDPNSFFSHKLLKKFCFSIKKLYQISKIKSHCNTFLRFHLSLEIQNCVITILSDKSEIMKEYCKYLVGQISQILYNCLKISDQIDNAVQLMNQLALYFPIECGQSFITQEIIHQIIFILDTTRKDSMRKGIFHFFSLTLKNISKQKLIILLNLHFHNKLAEILRMQLYMKNQDIICSCLKNIRLLFGNIQQQNDSKLLSRCLNSIQSQEGFDKVLEQMTFHKHSQKTQKQLGYILSEYYSSQCDQEY